MKLSLDALRTRQRLRIRVLASPPSFVNALQTASFGSLGAFQESSSATSPTYLLGKGCPSSVQSRCKAGRSFLQAGLPGVIIAAFPTHR
jgi:hypothetical protein